MFYLILFLSSLILSLGLTGLARSIGFRFGVVQAPRPRDIHQKLIPRTGGVALFLAFLIVSIITFAFLRPELSFDSGRWFGLDKHFVGIVLAGLVVVVSMFIDDRRGLNAWWKLIFQVIAVAVVVASGIGIEWFSNPFGNAINLNSIYVPILKLDGVVYHFSLWSDLLTLVWLVGMMNVINFIDGVDGLAGGISAIAALIIFLLSISIGVQQPATAALAIILAGAIAGFLVWNFPPARIFMGDSGSMFLGLMLGVLAIISGGKLATAFLVLGFFIIDGVLVAGGRILRGENPLTTPDKTHLHHRFLNAGFSVRQSILTLYTISFAFGLLALRLKTLDKVFSAFVLAVLVVVLIKILNRRSEAKA